MNGMTTILIDNLNCRFIQTLAKYFTTLWTNIIRIFWIKNFIAHIAFHIHAPLGGGAEGSWCWRLTVRFTRIPVSRSIQAY
jgi:hypothetical protein